MNFFENKFLLFLTLRIRFIDNRLHLFLHRDVIPFCLQSDQIGLCDQIFTRSGHKNSDLVTRFPIDLVTKNSNLVTLMFYLRKALLRS